MEQLFMTTAGVPVYSYPNPHLHSFCLCLYVKAGPMYEGKGENGITHFLEHVVIRNVNRLMDGELYQTLDRLGLSLNGATCKEFVHFSVSGASVHFREAARIFL
ncbi:MAG: insulinase family protein, partial [Lachnospiraceae bacterium]|nr:insulinase family protein [Lachnospiraceae bacterium]